MMMERNMAVYLEGRGLSEAEPLGLLTEGAAGIAAIVLAIIALAGTATTSLASIAVIVIGVGLMVQAFNSAAEHSKMMASATGTAAAGDFGGEVMVDFLTGGTGIVLGILALLAVNAAHLVPAALIVFGGGLILSGVTAMQSRSVAVGGQAMTVRGSAATSGFEILIGLAVVVLGILSLVLPATSAALVLVGFIAVGAALLMVSATFSGAVMRLLTTATTTAR
jgi:hypothetical protein